MRRQELETCQKSPVKQRARSRLQSRRAKSVKARDKTPGSRQPTATPSGSRRALEAIAAHLSAASAASRSARFFAAADAFVWHPDGRLAPVPRVNRVELGLLKGIDRMRDILIENTERFANGLPANNALLWGARGMGKSSLVKAAHASINAEPQAGRPAEADRDPPRGHREPAGADGRCCAARDFRFIVFCDDLSFDGNDASYKSLKAVLEGGIEGRPDNVILYATSNRRHLLPREMIENERSTAINPGEAVEEKVSLSDRFGLWLGFHRCSQDEYLAMVEGYCGHFGIKIAEDELRARGAGMVDHARLALRPRRLAVHAGTGGAARRAAGEELCRFALMQRALDRVIRRHRNRSSGHELRASSPAFPAD